MRQRQNSARIDEIDISRKEEMRKRILRGPPYSLQERKEILLYCRDDGEALTKLLPRMVRHVRSLPHGFFFRSEYSWALAKQESRGIPIDLPTMDRIRDRWDDIQSALVASVDKFGIYETGEDGKPHWSEERFERFVEKAGINWPRHESGALDHSIDCFEEMCGPYPWLTPLREVRSSLAKLRLNSLAVGYDGRNRTGLRPYESKTGRNQPSNSKYIFGHAKWTRSLISQPEVKR
jgi:DNA polymerase I